MPRCGLAEAIAAGSRVTPPLLTSHKVSDSSKAEFSAALSDLEEVPDLLALLEDWLDRLESEGGIGFMVKLAIWGAASKIFRLQVMGRKRAKRQATCGNSRWR